MTSRATPWAAYVRIAGTLRERVKDLPAGAPLPSETALAVEFSVVRNTIRRALAVLSEEGLIETVAGRGHVVRHSGAAGAPVVAAYRRIAEELSAAIADGSCAPGQPLPSETALTVRYGVSRGTIRQALAVLEAAGQVVARHGKGRFVDEPGTNPQVGSADDTGEQGG